MAFGERRKRSLNYKSYMQAAAHLWCFWGSGVRPVRHACLPRSARRSRGDYGFFLLLHMSHRTTRRPDLQNWAADGRILRAVPVSPRGLAVSTHGFRCACSAPRAEGTRSGSHNFDGRYSFTTIVYMACYLLGVCDKVQPVRHACFPRSSRRSRGWPDFWFLRMSHRRTRRPDLQKWAADWRSPCPSPV